MLFRTFLLLLGISIAEAVEINEQQYMNRRAQKNEDVSTFSTHRNRESTYLRKLQTSSTTAGALADLFNFTLAITPDATHNTSICSTADDNALRNDVNMVLLNFGSSKTTLSDLCAQSGFRNSSSLTSGQRKLALRSAYVWTGGGACKGCSTDNFDIEMRPPDTINYGNETGRSLQLAVAAQRFGSFSSKAAAELEDIMSFQIVPRHPRCLGLSPTIYVKASETGINELRGNCTSNSIPMLSVSNLAKDKSFPFQSSICQACISLDFSSTGATKQIRDGTYVSMEWKRAYGVTVTASSTKGAYTPSKQARIYDTSLKSMKDFDLGSPNNKCGGPGVGLGGQPGQPGENCVPLKNVLIIQDSPSSSARASNLGGNITFTFDVPVFVSDIGFIDIDQTDQKLVFLYQTGKSETFTFLGLGNNAVQRVVANQFRVKQVVVILTGKAAVTVLNYCPVCSY